MLRLRRVKSEGRGSYGGYTRNPVSAEDEETRFLFRYNSSMASIRAYISDDFDAVTRLWRAARELAFPDFQHRKGHTFEEDCNYFQNVIL